MALLEVEQVRRSFGGLVAVDQVNFAVAQGQIKSVIGPNGAGKTTLFNLISGMLKPERGAIRFQGKPIGGLPPCEIARAGVSRTFQNPSLFPRLTVLENVMIGRHLRSRGEFAACALRWLGQSRRERALEQDARKWLQFVGLDGLAQQSAGILAFGQLRMLELARALATEPALLLLDEPASGLNTKEKLDLGKLIQQIRQLGITILLVEHDMSLVMEISDELLVLHHGKPIAEGTPQAIRNDPQVISVYLGTE